MATIKPEVRKILEQFGLNPREALWDCHGTWVLLHKSCPVSYTHLTLPTIYSV